MTGSYGCGSWRRTRVCLQPRACVDDLNIGLLDRRLVHAQKRKRGRDGTDDLLGRVLLRERYAKRTRAGERESVGLKFRRELRPARCVKQEVRVNDILSDRRGRPG